MYDYDFDDDGKDEYDYVCDCETEHSTHIQHIGCLPITKILIEYSS